MKTVDINSPEFQQEFLKTEKFAHRVINQFNWKFNPNEEIVERVLKGLTNNKILYGKRFCPCFPVEKRNGKYVSSDDRICPCPQAIEKEIPEDGVCHCGIFCNEEYVKNELNKENKKEEIHIEGLSVGEIEEILQKDQILGRELEILLQARQKGLVSFKLIDIREPFENQMMRIKGTDKLLPISKVQFDLDEWMKLKNERIIIYCHVGSRSAYLQRALKEQLGFDKVGNLTYGIADYFGEIERG
ncbi:sulfurtransferase [Caminibacter mediatlanticus TB-2]|uniref:Rhodanese-like protein n=1 Tax=Caminibacter mediatlanticus TB-2 TaxID=391592 RepID=A0AAI9F259_9BACT|nr:ferredoxin-thioredoxin reductase catalytic domain-containing protein [Caminibacter mediatlanticus]EDM23256.1 Rhodanese-like protein [Caminibacter mediatlanticus TB-2]QCT94182.1 sulfurtransferase [Caminibacter mediatlanticus TB-2]